MIPSHCSDFKRIAKSEFAQIGGNLVGQEDGADGAVWRQHKEQHLRPVRLRHRARVQHQQFIHAGTQGQSDPIGILSPCLIIAPRLALLHNVQRCIEIARWASL